MPAFGGEVISARWPFPMRRDQVDDARREPARSGLERELLLRVERRQVVEQDLVTGRLGRLEVDRLDLQQREVALALLRRADLAADRVARAEVEAADLRRRHVDVVGPGEVVLVRRAQEPVALRHDLEHALREDLAVALGLGLQDREQEVLLAHARRVLDLELLRELRQVLHALALQVADVGALARHLAGRLDVDLVLAVRLVARVELALARRAQPVPARPATAPAAAPVSTIAAVSVVSAVSAAALTASREVSGRVGCVRAQAGLGGWGGCRSSRSERRALGSIGPRPTPRRRRALRIGMDRGPARRPASRVGASGWASCSVAPRRAEVGFRVLVRRPRSRS